LRREAVYVSKNFLTVPSQTRTFIARSANTNRGTENDLTRIVYKNLARAGAENRRVNHDPKRVNFSAILFVKRSIYEQIRNQPFARRRAAGFRFAGVRRSGQIRESKRGQREFDDFCAEF
jgi:hypothetical protein